MHTYNTALGCMREQAPVTGAVPAASRLMCVKVKLPDPENIKREEGLEGSCLDVAGCQRRQPAAA